MKKKRKTRRDLLRDAERQVNRFRRELKLPEVKFPYPRPGFATKLHSSNLVCPQCGSNDLSVTDRDGDNQEVYEEATCGQCGAEWTELYRLIGVTDIKTGDSQ
jgi:hypothetical protein